jgi:hypothetical protein
MIDDTTVQTAPIEPASREFDAWTRSQRFAGRDLATELAPTVPAGAPERAAELGPGPEAALRSLQNFHAYRNFRRGVDWNTCGQAAIASIADFHDRDPYPLPRPVTGADGRKHWDDGQIIDTIVAAGHGPDVVFGWGTTGGRIRDALSSYGLTASVGHSGLFSAGWKDLWHRLRSHVDAGLPVPVLIDLGALPGGPSWTAHWPIVHAIRDGVVHLGNCSWAPTIDESTFLRAWHCWFLPYGFNHCAVYAY